MYMEMMTKEGPVPVSLANFAALIEEEQVRDDGAETKVEFLIKGTLSTGEPLPPAIVSASKFGSMNWPLENWGNGAAVFAGFSKRDHLRCAIQLLSNNVNRKHIYTHTGWVKIKKDWYFLHAGGAIGADGPANANDIYVDQHGELKQVKLPDPPSGAELQKAIEAALSILEVAPGRISYPLFAATFRAPMAEAISADLSISLTGFTGTQKTSLAAVIQAFFGACFTASNIPANWTSTANALEKISFLAKDVILIIDDFCPQGTGFDVARLNKEADRILRGAGNQAGRGRMSADGKLRPTYYPRGLIIITGEDIPRGQSLRARIFTLEIEPGNFNLERLTKLQSAAAQGILAQIMGSYVSFMAKNMDQLKTTLPAEQLRIRDEFMNKLQNSHDRTPDICASLFIGFQSFISFAREAKAITDKQAQEYLSCAEAYILEAAVRQAELLAGEDPVSRFLQLTTAAISSGQAHLADAVDGKKPYDGENWGWCENEPRGNQIGWLSGDYVYLQPDAAFAVTQRMANTQGAALAIGQKTLWKRMQEKKVLAEATAGRNITKKTVAGKRKNVLCFLALMLEGSGQSGQRPENADE